MLTVRRAAVAGRFYPEDPYELRRVVSDFIHEGQSKHPPVTSPPKAIIVPHAGYIFSGPVAGSAYAQLLPIAESVERVILVGPSHFIGFAGMASSAANFFQTPLGRVAIDSSTTETLNQLPQVRVLDEAHAAEHSLEVQLPFLQLTLGPDFLLTPLAVGSTSAEEVAEVFEVVWGGRETLFVVSSDLSHYHDYATAQRLDRETTQLIESLHPEQLSGDRACGYGGIRGLLQVAKRFGLQVTALDVRNSGDTAGPRDQVVGYGAYVVH